MFVYEVPFGGFLNYNKLVENSLKRCLPSEKELKEIVIDVYGDLECDKLNVVKKINEFQY